MPRPFIAPVVLGLFLALVAGCGAPSLHSASTPGAAARDPGLIGEWATSDSEKHAAITGPAGDAPADPYRAVLTVRDKGQLKTTLDLELSLTQIGGQQYMDLFLTRAERDKLVESYGFLAVPMHQIMKVSRDGDTLRVWPVQGDWLEGLPQAPDSSHDRVTVGGGDTVIITAPTDQVRDLLARHGDSPHAFGDVIVFHRVRR